MLSLNEYHLITNYLYFIYLDMIYHDTYQQRYVQWIGCNKNDIMYGLVELVPLYLFVIDPILAVDNVNN